MGYDVLICPLSIYSAAIIDNNSMILSLTIMHLNIHTVTLLPQHVATLLTYSTPNRCTSEVVADYERYLPIPFPRYIYNSTAL